MRASAVQAKKRLRQFATAAHKETARWFFKSAPGEYGAHDKFIGVKVPDSRLVAKEFSTLSLSEVQKLIASKIHEDRLLALIILVNQFKKADIERQQRLAMFYLKNLKHVNNWDLVDSSAEYILGPYLRTQRTASEQRQRLLALARSKDLWRRRIGIMTTFHFIRRHSFENTFLVADVLLHDSHDLIHKAVGWMIREVGNRDPRAAADFLQRRYKKMPRTMLRYAIEKLPKARREAYLDGDV